MNNQELVRQQNDYKELLEKAKEDKAWWVQTSGKKIKHYDVQIQAFNSAIEQIDNQLMANAGS